jgi:hypothetical protein
MNENKKRKIAAFISLVVAAGNIGVIATSINMGTFRVFLEILPTSPNMLLIVITGFLALIIGTVLFTRREIGKQFLLAALIISVVIFVIAAFQMSIVLGFVLFWPWSLYRFYRSETA